RGTALPFGSSGQARSSASCWRARHASFDGSTWPFSQRDTVENVTLSACARPARCRQARMMRPASLGGFEGMGVVALTCIGVSLWPEATQMPGPKPRKLLGDSERGRCHIVTPSTHVQKVTVAL